MIERTAAELIALQAKGEATAEAITDAFLASIKSRDGKVQAYQFVDEETVRAQAKAVDAKLKPENSKAKVPAPNEAPM